MESSRRVVSFFGLEFRVELKRFSVLSDGGEMVSERMPESVRERQR